MTVLAKAISDLIIFSVIFILLDFLTMSSEFLWADLTITTRLRIARLVRGYKNKTSFAKASKSAVPTYHAHEDNKTEMKVSDLIKYASFLDVSPLWFLNGSVGPLDHKKDQNKEDLIRFEYYRKIEVERIKHKEEFSKKVGYDIEK